MTVETVRLKELIRVHYGRALKKANRDSAGVYAVFGSNGKVGKHSERLVDYPTLVVGRKGSVGSVTYAPDGGWPIDTAFYIERLKPNALDLRYLFYALGQCHLEDRVITTSIPGLSRDDIYSARIPLPPLPEQRRIAAILDKADAVRRKRQHTLALADQFLRSAFLDLFGDPVTNPKGWPVESFEECCEAIFKGAFDLKAASYRNEGIPFIRIADIQDRTIDLSNAVFIDEETHEKYGRSELTPGDIVFSKVGTIDRIAAIPKTIPRCNCSQNNVGARLKPDLLQVEFALALLTTSAILNQIRAGSKKAVQDKLVLSELRRLSVILPPAENQHRFTSIVEFVERQRAYQRAHLAKLDALFASLQQRAFRGKL